jgi:hypothetical protein
VAYRGKAIASAIRRLQAAEEVVTYNGNNHDLRELGRFAGLPGDLPLQGIHTDMRSGVLERPDMGKQSAEHIRKALRRLPGLR